MQIIRSQKNIIEKVIRDKEGRLVRATFQIYENAGRIKARLVDFVYITSGNISGKVLAFGHMSKTVFDIILNTLVFHIKPGDHKIETIYNLGSKPRAPTLI